MDFLPVFLQLQAELAIVVGGGRIAARKVELLRRAGARVKVIAPALTVELQQLSVTAAIQHVSASFAASQLEGAAVVVAATSNGPLNSEVSAAARERRIPVNVVDDPAASTFIFPAIIDRSPVVIAISSAGRAPVLARGIRESIEALLPGKLGALARFMGERREQVKRALRPSARRAFWERIVDGVVGARMLAGDEQQAASEFDRELRATNLTRSPATGARALGECYLIGAGPGDPDLLTLRALQLLQRADVILYDRLVPPAVLERARRDAERVFVGKQLGDHNAQERINELLVSYARRGLRVARLKGGDPLIFGRGGEEAEVLAAHGIPYLIVPGITAALGAAASANIPLTHRLVSQCVTLVAGHVLDDESLDWRALARSRQTIVFYMGVRHLPQIVTRLLGAGALADLPVAVVERATLPEQRALRGTLSTIVEIAAAAQIEAPAVLMVGEVAGLLQPDAQLLRGESMSADGALA